MATCFMIQPFDGGKFDKRYDDIFAPAIRTAGLEPYRVDRDPSAEIPIDDIETGIKGSDACLADISTDNPNVWFELGYAIAIQKEVALVCSNERQSKFPFDVRHRAIIQYGTDSSSDFDKLKKQIEQRLRAALQRRERLGQVGQIHSVAKMEGLDQHEIAVLVAITEEADDTTRGVSAHRVKEAMEKAGFTKLAVTLGLKTLGNAAMVERFEDHDYNGEPYIAYRVTEFGLRWLLDNRRNLSLKNGDGEIFF